MASMEFVGGKQLAARFRASPKNMRRHFGGAMNKAVITIESNTRPLTPVFTGRLRNSIGSQVISTETRITGYVGSTLKDEIYPSVMEWGRRSGSMPPPDKLERWVKLVLKVPEKKIKGTAYVVARSIGKRGIRGRFFLNRGYRRSLPKIRQYIALGHHVFVRGLTSGRH